MSLSLRLLGTSASRPTIERNVSSIALVREGETLLFDCGEGTQRQMMRYGVAFSLEDIFFTHFHADHLIGLIGLTRTMALQGRTEPLRLWGPKGATRILRAAERFGADRLTFEVGITELEPGTPVPRKGYAIVPFAADHGGASALGYALVEEERRGRFNPELARALGIPEGPLWGRIHRGEAVTLEDGRVIEASVLVGERRRGRRVVITGDTRPRRRAATRAAGRHHRRYASVRADDRAVAGCGRPRPRGDVRRRGGGARRRDRPLDRARSRRGRRGGTGAPPRPHALLGALLPRPE